MSISCGPRTGALETSGQILVVFQFQEFIQPLYLVFCGNSPPFTLQAFLAKQQYTLHGYQRRLFRNIPKILYVCFRKILSASFTKNKTCRLQPSTTDFSDVNECVKGSNSLDESLSQNDDTNLLESRFKDISPRILKIVTALLTVTWNKDVNAEVEYWKKEFNTNPNAFSKLKNGSIKQTVLSKLAFDWLKELKNPILRLQDLLMLAQDSSANIWEQLETLEKPVVCTLVLIARFLGCLKPLPLELELSLVRRFVELLLQIDDGALSDNCPNNHLPINSLDFPMGSFSKIYAEAVNLMQTLTDILSNSSDWNHCRISTCMFSKSES
ncbi:hypothetical protein PHET_04629 [Paragonimus heterotremus]|uniref:Uncharacterized protein n=1 Tax=Paragonimus heterotremus TaxID=100268 RepID=A0A8J4TCA0_9TREM|nr:hypothetical protein PHET_04629 [Paragonimus heterotremus]